MPHLAADAISAWLNIHRATPVAQLVLDAAQRSVIVPALEDDAGGLFYSAIITLADALKGISLGYFSWATVKLYYSSFYAVRSLLAANNVSLFYVGSKPYSLYLVSGSSPKREHGVTHKVVWSVLGRELSSSPLLGSISSVGAYEWLTHLREEANYKNARFPDPIIPSHFTQIDRMGIPGAVALYVRDTSLLYPFDPDHAAIAYPIECLRIAGNALRQSGINIDVAEVSHIHFCLSGVNISPSQFLNL